MSYQVQYSVRKCHVCKGFSLPVFATDMHSNADITSQVVDQSVSKITELKQVLYYLNEGKYDYVFNSPILGASEIKFCSNPASYSKVEKL